jgi:hypothetical protein
MPKKIVSEVAQADSRADAQQPDILQFRTAHAIFDTPGYMVDMTTYLGLQPVELLLQSIQRTIPRAFLVNEVKEWIKITAPQLKYVVPGLDRGKEASCLPATKTDFQRTRSIWTW